MRENKWVSIIVAILISYLTSYIVYFGFTSNYSVGYFSKASYKKRFESGVFNYRPLSRYFLLSLDGFLDTNYPNNLNYPDKKLSREVRYLDNTGNNNFYKSLFYLNTFFLVLTSIIAVLLLDMAKVFKTTASDRSFFIFFIPILINITQFCIVPYDTLSYFLEISTFYIYLKYFDKNHVLSVSIICALIIIATLNRESSAITVALLATLILARMGSTDEAIVAILAILACMSLTYLSLRCFLPSGNYNIGNETAGNYLLKENQLGLLFWILFLYLSIKISNTSKNKKIIALYHAICLPYIVVVLIKGVLWEVRLYIPLFLSSIFIAKLDEEYLKFSPKEIFNQAVGPLLHRKHYRQ